MRKTLGHAKVGRARKKRPRKEARKQVEADYSMIVVSLTIAMDVDFKVCEIPPVGSLQD
jgi:hypothetical protein